MTFTYNTLSQAQTFIKSYDMVIACGGAKGKRATLIHAEPGVYIVEVA